MIELFEDQIAPSAPDDSREIRIKSFERERLLISFDRNFRGADDQELLSNLAKAVDAKLEEEFKKAFDPISILAIGGAFVLGSIAKGFLSKLGSDGYEVLKEALQRLFAKPKEGEKDRLLVLEFEVERHGERIIVEVIASNPTAEEIESLLSLELERLDQLVTSGFRPEAGLRKLVYELEKDGITLKFGVRRDCVPLVPKDRKPGI